MAGSSKQTTASTNTPYPAAQPLLNQAMGDALGLYKNGGLVNPNTMSTVVPFSQQTMQGMNGLQGIGQANTGGQGISGQWQNIINNGGFDPNQMTALQGIRDTATGSFNLADDPGFQQVLDKTQGMVNQNAGALGRYGSGTHQGVMTQQLGDLTARQYQNWQARKDQAQGALFNMGQQGQQNLGSAYQGMQDAYSPLMQVGSMYEDLMGRQMNDYLRIANERMNGPLANIQALLAIAGGGAPYATQTQTAQGPSSGFSNMMGAGLGGASLLKSLFGF
jgi:hypothetical protein